MNDLDIEKNFFGRRDILDLLKKRVMDLREGCRQNVALLGNQYVGKSAILRRLLASLDEPDIVPIYLDLENRDFNYFYRKFTGSLLLQYSKARRMPGHDDLSLLMESHKDSIPQTLQVIQKIQKDHDQGKVAASLMGLLMLPEIFTNETGLYCVLIFDEFQNLDKFGVPYVFKSLGTKIMTQKKCLYIVSSSFQSDARAILSEKLSLLFGNFETIEVDCFGVDDSCKFVRELLGDIRIGDMICHFLTDFTGGHPLYLNLIGRELRNLCALHGQKEIYQPLLASAVENMIFDRWGVISRHFELIINSLCEGKGNSIISSILITLANGKFRPDDMMSATGIMKSQINQKLARLNEQGIIVKNGSYYYLRDKLFKFWLKLVYQKRLRDIEWVPDRQRQQFHDEFVCSVEDFNVATRQDFSARIIDLIYCFDHEVLNLNGRKYKLPLFKSVAPCRFRCANGEGIDVIKACAEDSIWYIVSNRAHVGENDVNTIVSATRRNETKPVRYMIVSLQDLDENTRLRALQEHFWIWNEQELNTLLTLFGKPYILR